MAVETKWICDKCGHTQENQYQMWWIGVRVRDHASSPSLYDSGKEQLWCRACIEGLQLLPRRTTEKPAEPVPPPTLEDMIRAIVREEMPA